ncbi:GDSL-type esterase/lipase family protein [Listeria booriae]|uniref:GDSL-type esterase/lipase family protein n=1 Tax=Listeria booriae TaxID=1552123 RepID=UPI0016293C45|nr:GDSL-type esterase/lipase family protein [Listeria booriae]MBC1234334.1 lysophospholipase [Listeria booriae]MBC1247703.1 lysophospholipase [Listeria booriae]
MSDKTVKLTNMSPDITKFQNDIRAKYAIANQTAKKGQILFVGSSLMEIFPIEKFQQEQDLGLDKIIYNRGVRATTTADLLEHMDTLIFDLVPNKIFINIGSNDIGFNVPENVFLANYETILQQIKEKLPDTVVYVMAYYPINTVDDFGEKESEHSQLYEHRSNELNAAASAKVEKLAHKNGYEFINVNAGLTDSSGNLRKELTFDGAHMLPNGYEIVLENMKRYLE